MRNNYLACTVLLLAGLMTGCASMVSNPFSKDSITYPERVTLKKDDPRRLKVSYLSRYMMDYENRSKIEYKVDNDRSLKNWNSLDAAVTTQTLTGMAMGDLGSPLATSVGTSVFVAGSVLNAIYDGSNDSISTAYLPATFDNISIETHQDALDALNKLVHQRVQSVADALGWQAQCQYQCDSNNQIWHLTNSNHVALPAEYIYKPKEVSLLVTYADLIPVEEDDMVSAVIGEKIAWKTKNITGFAVGVYESVAFDQAGLPKKLYFEEQDIYGLEQVYDLSKVQIGRDLLRIFHGTPYTISGTTVGYPNQVFYNTDIYTIRSKINDYIADDNLLLTR